MAIDVRTFAQAQEPWSYTDLTGHTWVAREISAPEVLRWSARFERGEEHVERRLARRLFAWRPWFWWSGDPAARLYQLPVEIRKAAFDDFFHSRRRPKRSSPSSVQQNSSSPSSPTHSPASDAEIRA